MLTNPDRFKHNKSSYERPDDKYRCGRLKKWRKPCAEGPLLNGKCSQKENPCKPILSSRTRRSRAGLFFLVLVISSFGWMFALSLVHSDEWSPMEAGPLSEKHKHFTSDKGCVACHQAHENPGNWIKEIFTETDLSNECMTCHTFAGPFAKPHNMRFPERSDLPDTTCVMCHTEHKGLNFNISAMSDARCNTCHIAQFESFTEGHPPYSEKYPHEKRTDIQFDHKNHMHSYFKNPQFMDRSPQDCMSCHSIASDRDRYIQTGNYEQNCASCHDQEIMNKGFVVFRSPELTENFLKPQEIWDVCQSTIKIPEGEEFQSLSDEEPTEISGYLLGIDFEEPEEYSKKVQKFMFYLAKHDVKALKETVKQRTPESINVDDLVAGLSPEMVKKVACAWVSNHKYKPLSEARMRGWFASGYELGYRPVTHKDPVLKAWIELLLHAVAEFENTDGKNMTEGTWEGLMTTALSAGRCVKCHSIQSGNDAEGQRTIDVNWRMKEEKKKTLTYFSHGTHLPLLGKGNQACLTCHKVNPGADYAGSFDAWEELESGDIPKYESNFRGIKKETCMQCHGAEHNQLGNKKIRQDCLLCHSYHQNPSFTKSMLEEVKS